LALYVHPDGFEAPFGTVQGVRVSNDFAQWTSPDAYAGDVHDPLSEKPYMLNRNNPYEYSDPTGYEPLQQDHDGTEERPASVNAGGDAEIDLARSRKKRPGDPSHPQANPRYKIPWPDKFDQSHLPPQYEPPKNGPRRNSDGSFVDRFGNTWTQPPPGKRHGRPHWDVDGKHWRKHHPDDHNVDIYLPPQPGKV
jgi:hypothetical protein